MDCCFGLFINSEQFFAHLFNTTRVCWAGVLEVMTLLFAFKGLMLGCTSYLYGGAVMVMPLLFTITALIAYRFQFYSARGCTCDKVFARMFMIVPPIAIGC